MTPKIQAVVTKFVEDLTRAIQQEGAAAFVAALGGEGAVGNGLRASGHEFGNGRRKPGPKPKAAARATGAKRTTEEIDQLTKAFVTQVKKTPGQNVETLAKTLGVTTKDLQLPVQKALARPAQVSTKGQRRGTKYFPK